MNKLEIGSDPLKILKWLINLRDKLYLSYQNIHQYLFAIMVMGILEYFFLFEVFVVLLPLALEAGPILIVIILILAVRGIINYSRRKVKENKHLMLFNF